MVVPEGEDGDADEDGDEVFEQRHPQTHTPILPLPEWLQKALGKDSAVCSTATSPWSDQVLERASGLDQPIF